MIPSLILISILQLLAVQSAVIDKRHGPLRRHTNMADAHATTWKRDATPHGHHPMEISVKLHAHDQDRVEKVMDDLLDENSPNFRKWLTAEEAWAVTAPHPDTVDSLLSYLEMNLVDLATAILAPNNRSLTFQTTVDKANDLFNANYGFHSTKHHGGHRNRLATPSYDIPAHLHGKVAMLDPGTDLAVNVKHSTLGPRVSSAEEHEIIKKAKRQVAATRAAPTATPAPSTTASSSSAQVTAASRGAPAGAPQNKPIAIVAPPPNSVPYTSDLSGCSVSLYPNCLRALYRIPVPSSAPATSVGALNLRPYVSNSTNLMAGYARLASNIPSTYLPTHIEITTGTMTATGTDSTEPDGDLQVLVPLAYPMQVYDFEGSNLDGNAVFAAVAQMGTNGIPRPDVLSVSYGFQEFASTNIQVYCTQTDAITLQGTTLVCSSGDFGAQDNQFPSLCPRWVSVGASQIKQGNTVTALQVTENSVGTFSYKGSGGFSRYAPAQSYQVSALASYRAQYLDPTLGNLQSNAAAPDVAAQGRDILFYYWTQQSGGGLYLFAGTSASAPVVGALLAVVNSQLAANGKALIGNPLTAFYNNPGFFRDVVEGDNSVSGSGSAWPARTGYDAATGLGTLLFSRILAYYNQ